MMQRLAGAWLCLTSLALVLGGLANGTLVELSRDGCGTHKGCLFRPSGCHPMHNCTIGMIFYVSGENRLTVQLSTMAVVPPPPLQYIAVAYSFDTYMGNDYVIECILNPRSTENQKEVELFASYNEDGSKSNTRTYLNETERILLFENVRGEAVDGHLRCEFTQQIVPQFPSKNGRIWSLNHKYYIFGATGTAQPDEINVHDLTQGSGFYPIISQHPINPALIGKQLYRLPEPYNESKAMKTAADSALNASEAEAHKAGGPDSGASGSALVSLVVLSALFALQWLLY